MDANQSQALFRDGLQPRSSDVFIAIMGVTGSGKSTFISRCCTKMPVIGHNLQACTTTVDVYPCQLSPTTTVYLIDTPGFDDTSRSDNEVLCEIASWLTTSYTAKIRLSGIIYLHRISDQRMQGSAKKNLFMFKKLCGPNALKHVILATTMWDRVSEAEGKARENELTTTPDFWGWMVSQGSRVNQHAGDKKSALRLIQILVQDNSQVTLALQQQMANENKSLEETDAGKELRSEIIKERKKFEKSLAEVQEQTAEALKARDKESERALREVQDDYKDRINQLERSRQNLKIDMEELHRQQSRKLEAKLQEAQDRHEDQLRQMERDRARKEAELLRERQEAEQRHLEVSAQLKQLQLQENAYTPDTTRAPSGYQISIKQRSSPRGVDVDDNSLHRHEVSLAIAGNSFFFRGPKRITGGGTAALFYQDCADRTPREWRPGTGDQTDMNNRSSRCMAMGVNESWMTLANGDKADWSSNIESNYPGFTKTWNNRSSETGYVSYVALGCDKQYFIKGTRKSYYHLNNSMIEDIDMFENGAKIDVVALGQNGSYIVKLTDGVSFWRIDGLYGGLREWIAKKSKSDKRKIAAAALSLTDDYFVVAYDDGTAWVKAPDQYRKMWESWVTSHYGSGFPDS